MKARVLIVGGGIMGTSIAQRAAQRTDPLSAPVVLAERRAIGAGSSGRSGAILRQHYAERAVAAMARDSLREYSSFEGRTGRSIGFQRTGVLTLAGPEHPDWCERIRQNVAMLADIGIRIEVAESGRIRDLVPGIEVEDGSVGAWEPDAGFVDPQATLDAFATLARAKGAVTRVGVEVTAILVEGGRVRGAETSEGRVDADQVVVVAGPWSAGLLQKVGIEVPLRVLRPENHFLAMPNVYVADGEEGVEASAEGQHLGFDMSFDDPEADAASSPAELGPTPHPVLIDVGLGFYCACEPKRRRTRVGRTEYVLDEELPDPDLFDEDISEETKSWAREVLARRLPEYGSQKDAGSLACWYTLTPDVQPVIGPAPGIDGLTIVTGFSGHGFKLAPSVGEGVAQMLFGEPINAFEPELFAPGRFREGQEWTGRFGL